MFSSMCNAYSQHYIIDMTKLSCRTSSQVVSNVLVDFLPYRFPDISVKFHETKQSVQGAKQHCLYMLHLTVRA